jgi:malonyl-CoA/methylmalonyl-CoA synthetase
MRSASILEAFLSHTAAAADLPIVISDGQPLSRGQLAAAAAGWAARLHAVGCGPQTRVALFLSGGPEFIAAYLGAQLAGAAVVLINTQYRAFELAHIVHDSQPTAIVCRAADAELLHQAVSDLQAVLIAPDDSIFGAAAGNPADWPLPTAEMPALLAYTSGTTGRAKGAVHTHASLLANAAAVSRAWQWSAADRLLLMLPLFHIHGLGVGVHGTLLNGASLELHAKFDADQALERLSSGSLTLFFGVPTMYGRLLEAQRRRTAAAPQLRLWVSGSAPLSPQVFDEFRSLFGQTILERYGMTETGMNLTNPYDGERVAGTVGLPFPGQEARIVDRLTRAALPAGAVGEIQVRGPHLFSGYWRNDAATVEAFDADGWFNTGDLGSCDEHGRFTISGRGRELIISGGYNIYPREVEEVLEQHPEIVECAVVSLPHADLGEVPAAVVVRRAGSTLDAAQVIEYCRSQLAAYKRPRSVVFSDGLPRNALGKVQRHLIRLP